MKSSTRLTVLSVALAGIGVFSTVWTVIWAARGSYLTALIMALLAIWAFCFSVYFLVTALGVPKPRIDVGAQGVLLRPALSMDILNIVPAAAVSIAAALYLIFSRFGMVDYTPTGVQRATLPAGCVALLLFSVPTMYRRFKYRGGAHLRLDSTGFEVWNGQWGSFKQGTWDEIEQILDHPVKGTRSFNEFIVFVMTDGSSASLMADTITRDTEPLYEWVRFYWQHPEHRSELVDERGLRRLSETFTIE